MKKPASHLCFLLVVLATVFEAGAMKTSKNQAMLFNSQGMQMAENRTPPRMDAWSAIRSAISPCSATGAGSEGCKEILNVTAPHPTENPTPEICLDWPEQSEFWLDYARAVFCEMGKIKDWNCGEQCKLDMIAYEGSKPQIRVGAGPIHEVQFFVAKLPEDTGNTAGRCVAAFRGTRTNANILADVKFNLVPYASDIKSDPGWDENILLYCKDCYVHLGFMHAFLDIRRDLERFILDLQCQSVRPVGHSLGSAMATLASLHLRGKKIVPHVETAWLYGAPRVGDDKFRLAFKSAGLPGQLHSVRSCRGWDPVCRMAPIDTPFQERAYRHVGPEIWHLDPPDRLVSRIQGHVPQHCKVDDDGKNGFCFCNEQGDDKRSDWCANSVCGSTGTIARCANADHLEYHGKNMKFDNMHAQCRLREGEVEVGCMGGSVPKSSGPSSEILISDDAVLDMYPQFSDRLKFGPL